MLMEPEPEPEPEPMAAHLAVEDLLRRSTGEGPDCLLLAELGNAAGWLLPPTFGVKGSISFSAVTVLDLAANRLTELPPAVLRHPLLKRLNLAHNRLVVLPMQFVGRPVDAAGTRGRGTLAPHESGGKTP